jgi:hypothetical protein
MTDEQPTVPPDVDASTGEKMTPIMFSDWLKRFQSGSLDDKLSAAIDDVATAVMLMDKAGSLTLKLDMSQDGGALIVTADVNPKPPRPKQSAVFYHDPKRGGLSRRDPNQPQLPGWEDDE